MNLSSNNFPIERKYPISVAIEESDYVESRKQSFNNNSDSEVDDFPVCLLTKFNVDIR